MSWEQLWHEERTPWDAGASSPSLVALAQGELNRPPQGSRAFVPGCGAGWDVFTLAQAGYRATGLDIAPSAQTRFDALRAEQGLDDSRAELVIGDFFELELEPVDLIWDYTFFCALQPEDRPRWGETMGRLLRPGGSLYTLMFPWVESLPETAEGPPFSVHQTLYEEALSGPRGHFEQLSLKPAVASHPGREGREMLARWRRVG